MDFFIVYKYRLPKYLAAYIYKESAVFFILSAES